MTAPDPWETLSHVRVQLTFLENRAGAMRRRLDRIAEGINNLRAISTETTTPNPSSPPRPE